MTLGEVRALDAGAWKGPGFIGEKIPTLDEVLTTGGVNKRFYIEMKGGQEVIPALKASLERTELEGRQAVLIAFDLATGAGRERGVAAVRRVVAARVRRDQGRRTRY